ncbi:alpha/beta fold hydrolase [Nocardia sp. CS682]|uniref:alpha/beta fold hydrolase n=1 Tax=Nocardia sp. CS682 TaxID=1047172 RepID=UPI001074AE56|nr:alpha/beta hydrolase [Nocardia sp. CS682]QBS42129.1 alpha/beta hydrolase [Nocardia sp. CS682]
MTTTPNVLLVHGAWADGSSWNKVIERLLDKGFDTVVASQLPLRGFADDVAAVTRDLDALTGPTILVGHSYGGAVISQAGAARADVTGLVFVAAYAPTAGQSAFQINQEFGQDLPSGADLVNIGAEDVPDLIIARDRYHADFAADADPREAALLAATQKPTSVLSLAGSGTATPAWQTLRDNTWYQISELDAMIHPDLETKMAYQVATEDHIVSLATGHASMITQPDAIAELIARAAGR